MFSEKIKQLRKMRNLTQKELADKLFVEQTTVSSWERGKAFPDTLRLQSIADFFNVGVDELLGRETHVNNNVNSNNGVVIGQAGDSLTIHTDELTLSAQERDLIRIYKTIDCKQQIKLMQFAYELEEEIQCY